MRQPRARAACVRQAANELDKTPQSAAAKAPFAAIALATAVLSTPGPTDEDAVRAVERQWTDARYHADTATLMKLLLPEYRTVSARGIHSRDHLIAGVLKRGGHTVEPPYSTWPTPKIEIRGTTALAIFADGDASYSVDVFVFENGGWHAMHSQHTVITPQH